MTYSIPYGKQLITDEDINEVVNVLRSSHLTQGPRVPEFEENFSKFTGSNYALACSSGTAALHLSAMCLHQKNNKKVLTTPITFAATSNCIYYENGNVEFVDISLDDYLMNMNILEDILKKNPNDYQGIIPVNMAGRIPEMKVLRKLADKYGLWIIEDASHSLGSSYQFEGELKYQCGDGTMSDLTTFSFHPVKHITCGEGGMVTTNNKALYHKLQNLRTHGITKIQSEFIYNSPGGWYHEMQDLGMNYRMSDIQAALGNSQLRKIKKWVERRNEVAKKYYENLESCKDIVLPGKVLKGIHAFHLFIILANKRRELYDYLKANQIFCQVHYIPVYLHPFYQKRGFKNGLCPIAEYYYSKCLSLPIFPSITDDEIEFIIKKIKFFYSNIN